MFRLDGRTAFVTGGTRGIGLAIAMAFKEQGARVCISGTDEERTRRVAEKHGFDYTYGLLENKASIDKIAATLCKKYKVLDIFVNNAGYEVYRPIEDLRVEETDDIYAINAKAPVFLLQQLLPLLKKSKAASVINVTSIHQDVPVRKNTSYCMAKAALAMFTKTAALELAQYNIRVNNLAPGAILTDMNRELVENQDFDSWIPLGRVGNVEETAWPAVFLAADASSYMTGSTLYIDGGYKENLLRY